VIFLHQVFHTAPENALSFRTRFLILSDVEKVPSDRVTLVCLGGSAPMVQLRTRVFEVDFLLSIEMDALYPQRIRKIHGNLPGGSSFQHRWFPWGDSVSSVFCEFSKRLEAMADYTLCLANLSAAENLVILEPVNPSVFACAWKVLLDPNDLVSILLGERIFQDRGNPIVQVEGKNSMKTKL
jgi:hypothetical protein